MSPENRLNRITTDAMCVGCGMCQSIAGPDKVRVPLTTTGYERPIAQASLDHETVDRIYAVCPGVRVNGLPGREIDAETTIDHVWGPLKRTIRSWAGDPAVRHLGATGGVLTALAIYLLESRRVDFILHARESKSNPLGGEQHLSFTREDVLTGSGSRYGPTAVLIDIADVLDRNQPFAFIGKPCDISALRNLARVDLRVDDLCQYMLTPVCGGYKEPRAMLKTLTQDMGITGGVEELAAFRYRGNGCPGPTRAETKDGKVTEITYLDLWGASSADWSLPFRCKVCPDGIGESADIAAADTWPGGSPSAEMVEPGADDGTNAIMARTNRGLELMEAAIADGALAYECDVTPRDMDTYQTHQVNKKHGVWARYVGLKNAGQLYPETDGLRIADLAREQSLTFNLAQARGARERARQGRASEQSPVEGKLQ